MLENILTEIAGSGVLGGILAYYMYSNRKLTDTVINLVKNNTQAMTNLKNSIDDIKNN
jgi:hypothetical protein